MEFRDVYHVETKSGNEFDAVVPVGTGPVAAVQSIGYAMFDVVSVTYVGSRREDPQA